ncbi:MAG: Crp/Fnr family transcriptional regulator [Scytonema sp. RU_4_4]|nr:Crp/Fnr family transcriptional regulator [Scytonema sp. RU_4_4]NJR72822.1 Crp/Fnr family transcriptional regulator [Scytonema sp. CRU_2_7]
MLATVEQLAQIFIFSGLETEQLEQLLAHTQVRHYLRDEIILHEGSEVPVKLHAILHGTLQIKKTAATGKETILRILPVGEIFAAPALFGNGIAPATVVAQQDCQILTVERKALLEAIGQTPELALRIIAVLNQRLQLLHNTIHGLVSERAIVRLARLIQYTMLQYGTESSSTGQTLKMNLPHYQISRTIGITYEECARLISSLKSVMIYKRGKITIVNPKALDEIASGEEKLD